MRFNRHDRNAKGLAEQRERWMRQYQQALALREDYQPGRIDWDLASYQYSQGTAVKEAAQARQPFLGNPLKRA